MLAEIVEDASDWQRAQSHVTRHQSSDVESKHRRDFARAVLVRLRGGLCAFAKGTVLAKGESEGCSHPHALGIRKSSEGLVMGGEVYASGGGRSLIPMGRICRMLGVHPTWSGDGPRLAARGTNGMLPVVWLHSPRASLTSMQQGGSVVQKLTKAWRERFGPTADEGE